MPTLNSVFKQVYGEALESLGFKLIKSKYPYLVRLIGDEILHVITLNKGQPNDNDFNISSGIATLYRQRITLDESPSYNSIWLRPISYYYRKLYPLDPLDENSKYPIFVMNRGSFYYCEDKSVVYPFTGKPCEHSPLQAMEYALKITMEIMLPILDSVICLNSCIEYFHRFELDMNLNHDYEDFGNKYKDNFCNEGLLHIKTEDYESYGFLIEKRIERYLFNMANGIRNGISAISEEVYENERKGYEDGKPHREAHTKKIFSDDGWIAKAQTELEHRREENIKTLKSYGLDIKI